MAGRAGEADSSMIVPLIKRADAEGIGNPPRWDIPETDIPIIDELTQYLLVAYVFDLPDCFVYVTPRHCDRLQLAAGDLRALAVRNLTRRRAKPQIRRGIAAAGFVLDGNLESSLLLVDHLWPQIAEHLPGDLVAVVPSRDTLAFTGTEVPGGVATLTRAAEVAWRNAETRLLLTKSLLVRRGDTWRLFDPL